MPIDQIISSIFTRSDVIVITAGFLAYSYFKEKSTAKMFRDMGVAKHQQLKETMELNANQLKDLTISFKENNERLAQAIERQGGDIRIALENQSERMETIMRNTMIDSKELLKFYKKGK